MASSVHPHQSLWLWVGSGWGGLMATSLAVNGGLFIARHDWSFWTSIPFFVACGFAGLAVFCFVGALRQWSFPLAHPVDRRAASDPVPPSTDPFLKPYGRNEYVVSDEDDTQLSLPKDALDYSRIDIPSSRLPLPPEGRQLSASTWGPSAPGEPEITRYELLSPVVSPATDSSNVPTADDFAAIAELNRRSKEKMWGTIKMMAGWARYFNKKEDEG